ncbi:MAG: DUF2846 domain-containing protein [Deltaproteobacteria bacterium]|nr:DUF2846 domain-containing protein [Deltaproteobacteria bacterium]
MTRKVILLLAALGLGLAPLAAAAAEIHTSKDVYQEGEGIEVIFSGAPGDRKDWVSVAPVGAPDDNAGEYDYSGGGVTEGVVRLPGQGPGEYEARAYFNYAHVGYQVAARYRFQVKALDPAEKGVVYSRGLDPNNQAEAGADPNQALVYIYRDRLFASATHQMYLNLDGAPLVVLPNASFLAQVLPPGRHTFAVARGYTYRNDITARGAEEFQVKKPGLVDQEFAAGRVYYVRLSVPVNAPDLVSLELVSAGDGALCIQKYRLDRLD